MARVTVSPKLQLVYLVGIASCESNEVVSIHLTKDGALAVFHRERIRLLADAKRFFENSKQRRDIYPDGDQMYARMITNLSNEDPETIGNGPHDVPWIEPYQVQP